VAVDVVAEGERKKRGNVSFVVVLEMGLSSRSFLVGRNNNLLFQSGQKS
jgi:hypothetical protein